MKHVYVAGPIGPKEGRLERVHAAIGVAERIRRAGLYPFLPHLALYWDAIHAHEYECWMRWDMAWLRRCDALFRMPGHSPGADREVVEAERIDLPVFYSLAQLIAWGRA